MGFLASLLLLRTDAILLPLFISKYVMAFAIVIFAMVSAGLALQCHQCSSFDDDKCNDPFVEDNGDAKTTEFLKDCPADGNDYTLCRKTYQNVRGFESIIRSCGYEEKIVGGEVRDCYTTVLEEYNTLVCACKEDGCNGSSQIKFSVVSTLLTAILAIMFK